MANNLKGQDILNAYRTSISPSAQEELFLKINDINKEYQLTPGTERDFNNAVTFYMYSQIKNSVEIDKAENEISKIFGNSLLNYYNKYIDDNELLKMLSAIKQYNEKIDSLYTISKKEDITIKNITTIIKSIYGINYETLEITEGSYAHRILEEIKNNYLTKLLPRIAFYEAVLKIRDTSGTATPESYIKELSVLFPDIKITGLGLNITYSNDTDTMSGSLSPIINMPNSDIGLFLQKIFTSDIAITYNTSSKAVFDVYTISTYEQQFLSFATFVYIYKNLCASIDEKLELSGNDTVEKVLNLNINSPRSIEYENKNTWISRHLQLEEDLTVKLDNSISLFSNHYGIYTNIILSDHDSDMNLNLKVGYASDPYIALDINNIVGELYYYGDGGASPNGLEVNNYNINVSNISNATDFNRNFVITERLYKETDAGNSGSYYSIGSSTGQKQTKGVFFTNSESNIYKGFNILNICNLYYYINEKYRRGERAGKIKLQMNNNANFTKIIFDDLTMTNIYSKIIDNINKLIIYEDKTFDMYSYIINDFNTDTSISAVSDDLFGILDSASVFNREFDVLLNSLKIHYEFNKPNYKETDDTYEHLQNYEKRYASDIETYYAQNYYNVNYFELTNIVIDKKSEIFEILNYLYDNSTSYISKIDSGLLPSSSSDYAVVSICIAYKEFNKVIRDLTMANIQNRLISEYAYDTSVNIINTKLYDYVYNPANVERISSIPEDLRSIFSHMYTNPYIIRNSRVDDLISYIAGDIISFGTTSNEQDEIQSLITIYRETRDYFYRILLNKAFINEDQYDLYKQIYIKAYSIERFISSRLTNITEIQHYTVEDCRNFLISYGLKVLNDQIDKADFADSLLFRKRIISNYNNLMGTKGSRSIIDEFFKLFNYDTTEIALYKYLLYKDEPNVRETDEIRKKDGDNSLEDIIKFIPIEYESKNIAHSIKSNAKKAKKYDEFLAHDPYWDANELTKDIIDNVFDSPVNTKYLGIDLKKDIYLSFIKSKYTLSLIQYLYDKFNEKIYNPESTESIKYLDLIKVELDFGDNDSESGTAYRILDIYNAARFLFSLYICLSEYAYSDSNGIDYDEILYSNSSTGTKKRKQRTFYGINRTSTIANLKFRNNFMTNELVQDLFTTNYIESSQIGPDKTLQYYCSSSITGRCPAKYNREENSSGAILNELLFGNTSTSSADYLIPLRITSPNSSNTVSNPLFKTTSYNLLKYNTSEVFGEDYEPYETSKMENTSLDAIENAFKGINIINFLNGLPTPAPANEAEYECNNKKFKAIYYFEKFTSKADLTYPSGLDLGDFSTSGGVERELKLPESTNFYSYLFEKTIEFPVDYLNGSYNNNVNNINYNYDARSILNEIFESFYTVSDTDPVSYLIPDGHTGTTIKFKEECTDYIDNTYSGNTVITKLLGSESGLTISKDDDNNTYSITYTGDLHSIIEMLGNRIISISSSINTFSEQCQLMKIDLQFGESINNFFDFIKTCVNFFISYTAYLYQSSLIIKIDTKNETIPLTYKIYDNLEHRMNEYFYYDESIKIDELVDAELQ